MRFLAAFFVCLFFIAPATAAPKFPALTGRVVDDAHILSDATKSDLNDKLAALEAKTSRQMVVVTIASLGGYEISDYGYQLGRAWGIGQKKMNNGLLFIVAPSEHKTRVEVGYGLEPIVTDAFSSVVIQTQVLPHFRQNDFDGGVKAGVDALIQQLSLETSEAEARAAAAEHQTDTGTPGQDMPGWLVLLIFFGIFGFIFFQSWLNPGSRGGGIGGGPYMGGGGGGWSGGGGGFGGGGGSFGGGGSSGSW